MSRAPLLVLAALAAGGCYATHRVRPEQVGRVSGSFIETMSIPMVGAGGNLTTISAIRAESAITFDRPEGGTVTVKGRLDVDITTASGRRYRFEHPVKATLTEGVLDLRSASRSGRITLDEVRGAEVRSFEKGKTILAGAGIAAGLGLLVTALLLSI